MENIKDLFGKQEINLIELCNLNPELANKFVLNTSLYKKNLKSKSLYGIPLALLLNVFPKANDISKLVSIKGTIIRSSNVLLKNVEYSIECTECDWKKTVLSETDITNVCETCMSNNCIAKQAFDNAIGHQTLRIQDIGNPDTLSDTLEISAEGKWSGRFFPGERILVTGIVKVNMINNKVGEKIKSFLTLHALNIARIDDIVLTFQEEKLFDEFKNYDDFKKRETILKSFGSHIYGYMNVKLGLILAIIGGNNNLGFSENKIEINETENRKSKNIISNDENKEKLSENLNGDKSFVCFKTDRRSSSHVLLVGDSGTGKTQLMGCCLQIIKPAIKTNGLGTSDAGLTTCAIKQGGEWNLEAGALVLADCGLCCIDEFNSLKTNEKSGLLEVMEQQTLSVAKAGLVTCLNARCSIVAVCNVNNNFSLKNNLPEFLNISSPLISRFDLIFGLFDDKNYQNDIKKTDLVLSRFTVHDEKESAKKSNLWSLATIRSYIKLIRNNKIETNFVVNNILLKYYNYKRKTKSNTEIITIRMLESLYRLTEAHAKIVSRNVCTSEDAYISIFVYESGISCNKICKFDSDRIFIEPAYFKGKTNELISLLEIEK
ncbi:DNA replication licensing factor Mcm7 [Hamiltosporidium tvaerminnensis]|uniref:DNA replication licensing factor Mcm7 n=1 Tax=Hamiltosporidium tvaerminnensis TaxID=1176355 RepID=A0A4Q9L9Z4_9MICR|nr:DNA replication licensing factor Mcm7 [Hamiltosporidium tvaerminnensis]